VKYRARCIALLIVIVQASHLTAQPASTQPDDTQAAPLIESYLIRGDLLEGEKAVTEALRKSPEDDALQFQLGTVQFLRGVERLAQSLYQHGAGSRLASLPMLNLPIPVNPAPKPISYQTLRKIMETWLADLQQAESTLAKVRRADVKMPLHFALITMDFDGDAKTVPEDAFWAIGVRLNLGAASREDSEKFVIGFDSADAAWLRGYCHLLMAMDEFLLAYDFQELFEKAGHLLFAKVKSPYKYLQNGPSVYGFGGVDFADVIAFIHLINFPVHEPARLKNAHSHLQAMVQCSRDMWVRVFAETDDDNEWIPSPKQKGVMPNAAITKEMVVEWKNFLDEVDALLAGRKLIPFWRTNDDRGINLRKFFLEPRPFDLVLWIQGSAAAPYLEKGVLTSADVWRRLDQTFQGNFIGFAIWFN
jgi:hypothetical protein